MILAGTVQHSRCLLKQQIPTRWSRSHMRYRRPTKCHCSIGILYLAGWQNPKNLLLFVWFEFGNEGIKRSLVVRRTYDPISNEIASPLTLASRTRNVISTLAMNVKKTQLWLLQGNWIIYLATTVAVLFTFFISFWMAFTSIPRARANIVVYGSYSFPSIAMRL